ncbi:MAG: hypothetical protein EXS31_14855 [Pedosphaera sp.]|nr:hypothetical protein [Pedosphaera sp.]
MADDLERLAGKWTTGRKNSEGEIVRTSIEISKDKFKYWRMDAGGSLRLYAEGTVKIEKHGAFQAVRFGNIKGGASETELSDVDDDRLNIYQLGYDTLTLASNFDRERQEPPRVDVYKKAPKEQPKKK